MKLSADAKRFLAGPECPQVLKVSKHLAGSLQLFPDNHCKCECRMDRTRQTIFRVSYRAVLDFDTVKPCDETEREPLLQKGVELWLNGNLTLRLDTCPLSQEPVLVGRNQGTYQIHRYRPNEDIMRGRFCGTEGVLPMEKVEKRCCAPTQGLGSICGEGINTLKGWSLAVSYHSLMHKLSPDRICEPVTLEMEMDIDGVLIGPCSRIQQKRKASSKKRTR